jgi:hypothetical protein
MDASEANRIDLNTETSVNKLRELVKYWQDRALSLQNQIAYQNTSLKTCDSPENENSKDSEV